MDAEMKKMLRKNTKNKKKDIDEKETESEQNGMKWKIFCFISLVSILSSTNVPLNQPKVPFSERAFPHALSHIKIFALRSVASH